MRVFLAIVALFSGVRILEFAAGHALPVARAQSSGVPSSVVTPEAVRAALMADPTIIADVVKAYQAKQDEIARAETVAAVDRLLPSLIPSDAPFIGNPDGKHVVAEFFDYQCEFCRNAQPSLMKSISDDPQLKVVLREFPILGQASDAAARVAVAAGMQGRYVAMHDALFRQPLPLDLPRIMAAANESGVDVARLMDDVKSSSVTSVVAAGLDAGRSIGVKGTPTFVGKGAGMLSGYQDPARFAAFASSVVPWE